MIRPTFLSFETAKRALMTSQLGLDTVGNNISNVNTLGYTRQRVDQVSISSSGYRTKFQVYGSQFPGQGSAVTGITQIRDPFLDNRYRAEAANYGELNIKSNALYDINSIFDEIMKNGLHSQMDQLINAFDILKSDATSTEMLSNVRNLAKQLAQILNKNATELETVLKQQFHDMQLMTDNINGILQQIAQLNTRIKEDHYYGNPSNELMDQRNMLLDQLAEYVDISVEYETVKVTDDRSVQVLNVRLKGTDHYLVESGKYNEFLMEPSTLEELTNSGGQVSLKLVDGVSKLELRGSCDLTGLFENGLLTGSLGGYVNVINGEGAYATGSNTFRGVAYYRHALDDFAQVLADVMNGINTPAYDQQINSLTGAIVTMNQEIADAISNSATADEIAELEQKRQDYLDRLNGVVPIDNYGNPGFDWDNIAVSGQLLVSGGVAQEAEQTVVNGTVTTLLVNGVDIAGDLVQNRKDLLVGEGNDPSTVTAKTITISDEWDLDMNWLTTWLSPPIDGGEGTNVGDNVARFYDALKNGPGYAFDNYFKGSFQEYLVDMQSDMALDENLVNTLLDASYNVIDGIYQQRNAISAVNTDEEAINMMVYQNYYNAAARFMTVLDEALGTIIQSMGVVGR